LFGEQTGTVSSGLALIRIVDPGYRTPVARDQVLGSGTALILGFPLLLLINLPLTRFNGSDLGYAVVTALLCAYLVATIVAWRLVRRRFR
ncbi:MAG: sodium:glutamate symporter, partial [Rhodothermales bacterium]|nr:sodium:glutamate symporter [Rhodothermales bacterium]